LPGRDVLRTDPIEGGPERPAFYIIAIHNVRKGAVRQGRYKLIVSYQTDEMELFDLISDPRETRNIAEERPAKTAELRAILEHGQAVNAPGWHVRGCGCETPSELLLELVGAGPPDRKIGLESVDRVESFAATAGDGDEQHPNPRNLRLQLDLSPFRPEGTATPDSIEPRGGERRLVPDRDEIVLPSGAGPPKIVRIDGKVLAYAIANGDVEHSNGPLDLSSRIAEARVSASEPVRCDPRDRLTWRIRPEHELCEPHVRVWLAPPAEVISEAAVDPETIEQLRALGYDW
jgi:hypothetical protein